MSRKLDDIQLTNWPTRYVLVAAFVTALLSRVSADDFVHQFGRGTPGEPAFVIGFDPQAKEVDLRNGLRVVWKKQEGDMPLVGVSSVFGLQGDFQVELNYAINKLETPEKGHGSGLRLSLAFADSELSGLLVSHRREVDGRELIVVDKTLDNHTKHSVTRYEAPKLVEGIRLVRSGTTLNVSIVTPAGLTSIEDSPVSDAYVYPLGVRAFTGGASSDLDLVFRQLKVIGATLPLGSEMPPVPTAAWVWILLLSVLSLAVTLGWRIVASLTD